MPTSSEYKFLTVRLNGVTSFVRADDRSLMNWADVAEDLTNFGMEGWRLKGLTGVSLGGDSILYTLVLERSTTGARRKKK